MKKKLMIAFISMGVIGVANAENLPDISVGLNLTDGNSETLGLNVGADLVKKTGAHEVLLHADYNFAENTTSSESVAADGSTVTTEEDQTTIDNFNVDGQVNHLVNDNTYLLLKNSYGEDDIADIDFRDVLSVGLGHYLIKGDDANLGIEIGPAYTWEEVAGIEDDFFGWRLGERYDRKISDTSSVYQSFEYLPDDEFDEYLLNFVLGLETAVAGNTSLKIELSDNYDSLPAAGKDENDLSLTAAIVYSPSAE